MKVQILLIEKYGLLKFLSQCHVDKFIPQKVDFIAFNPINVGNAKATQLQSYLFTD